MSATLRREPRACRRRTPPARPARHPARVVAGLRATQQTESARGPSRAGAARPSRRCDLLQARRRGEGRLAALKRVRTVVAEAKRRSQMEQGTLPSRRPGPMWSIRTSSASTPNVDGARRSCRSTTPARLGRDPAGVHDAPPRDARRLRRQRAPRHDPDAHRRRRRAADACARCRTKGATAARCTVLEISGAAAAPRAALHRRRRC